MQRNVGIRLRLQRDDARPSSQSTELLAAANLRYVGTICKQHQNIVGSVQGDFYFLGPGRATAEALSVQPRIKASLLEIRLQTPGEIRPVFAGVRDEYTSASE